MKLPGTLAIEEGVQTLLPDGRWKSSLTPFESTYNVGALFFSRYMIVDRAGKIRFGFMGGSEKVLEAFIEQVLGEGESGAS